MAMRPIKFPVGKIVTADDILGIGGLKFDDSIDREDERLELHARAVLENRKITVTFTGDLQTWGQLPEGMLDAMALKAMQALAPMNLKLDDAGPK